MTLTGSPFKAAYPVNFKSGGDTTKDAFGKHIQEIERIYGLLNALNADKLSTDVFNNIHNDHVNASNPHPNLDLGNTKGSLPSSRVTGNFDFSRIEGNLPLSRTIGDLDTSRITGLANFVEQKIPKIPSVISSLSETPNGYAEINGTLLINWGKKLYSNRDTGEVTANFIRSFKKQCMNVVASLGYTSSSIDQDRQLFPLIRSYNTTSVTFQVQQDTDTERWDNLYINFIAIGF